MLKENRVLIITGGQVEEAFLSGLLGDKNYDMIIAADGGLVAANRLKITPHDIVGDFDSVPESILQLYRGSDIPIRTFPTEKDKTDTQIAIELALQKNATEIDIVGGTGSRLDHTLANIHLLLIPLQRRVKACILNANNKIYLKQENFTIRKQKQFGKFISLLPITERVVGLTLKGFKYPLTSVVLTSGSSLGISNEIVSELAEIELSEGILLVMETKD